MSWTLLAVFVCVLGLFTAGCVSNQPFRTSLAACDTSRPGVDCAQTVIETTPGYKLGFVEFDEQGWFWDRRQVRAVEQMIRAETGLDGTNQGTGIILLLFVHGWKNNAEFGNTNVAMMRATLEELGKAEQIQSGQEGRPARKIVGVYAGWRGLSAKLEPFKELSFWERKNTAHEIGHGAMTELLANLENLQKESNRTIPTNAPATEFIIVGHSFGGAAVYAAVSQIVTERFVDTVEHGRPLKPLGDLVILLNPAFEAARHYNLNELAVTIDRYPEAQRPVLAVFTSKGDWATHYAFPLGRFFSTWFQKNRHDKPQRTANRQALGWFTPFVTHDLVYDAAAKAGPAGHTTLNPGTQKHELHQDSGKLAASVQNVRAQRQKWHPNAPKPAQYSFDDCVLDPRPEFRPGDPFMIVAVDKQIMKDHDDITNPVLINFLREFIAFCHASPEPASK